MTYYVYFDVRGRFEAAVDSDSVENAIDGARQRFSDADFGEMYDVDGEEAVVQDEAGNYYPVAS